MAKLKTVKSIKINLTPELIEEQRVANEKAAKAGFNMEPGKFGSLVEKQLADKKARLADDSQVVEIEYDEATALGRPYNSMCVNGMDYTFVDGHITRVLTEDYKQVMKIIKS